MSELIASLQKARLFDGFAPGELTTLLEKTHQSALPAEHVFFNRGDANRSLFIITSGSVRVERDIGGDDVPLAILGAGQSFGEMSLLGNKNATARMVADEPCEVIELSQESLAHLQQDKPALWGHLCYNLALDLMRRLEETNELVANYVDINRALIEDPEFRSVYGQM